MKTFLSLTALTGLVALVTGATAFTSTPDVRDPAHPMTRALTSRAIDDTPPFECPFCGGNPELHRSRIVALEKICASAAMLVMP